MTEAVATTNRLQHLREISLRALARMYLPDRRRFVFRVRRDGESVRCEGVSDRYTAITLLGLAHEDERDARHILNGQTAAEVAQALLADACQFDNLGDVALSIWSAVRCGVGEIDAALARLRDLLAPRNLPTVEVAWVVTALALVEDHDDARDLCDAAERRLRTAYEASTGLFRHHVDRAGGMRGHVGCFADLVYPIQAMAHYARARGDSEALAIANYCGAATVAHLGPAGQWWWHYDVRSGKVLEGYPVYAVHQDAMAPMALLDLAECGGKSFARAINRGLDWLDAAPELNGGSLIDDKMGVIWRKVGRREPAKFVRKAQTLASAVHPFLRFPGAGVLFPPRVIDDECRPYHLGWLLYAWPQRRAATWAST